MPTQTLGKVKLTPRGAYDPAATYVPLDIVSYGGGSYCALKNVTGVTPTGDDVNYQLLAESGADGKSPQISESKTWLVWDAEAGEYVDTGVSAAGEKGDDGKSAYAYAVEGGYTGTEAEFAAKLAEEMPEKLPNPNALTFTGEVSATYDGSAPMSVEIPSGGGSGGSGSMQETVLASGVVATGTAKWHKENTGLTVADLQEWKLWGFVCLASSQNTTFGINFGNSTVVKVASTGCKVILSWFDDDHNAINVVDLLTQDGFIKIDKSFFSVGYGGRASKGGLHGGYIPYVNNANDTVYIYTHDELAEDVAFKIVGLIK